ncbi:MAG: hypothetical protein V4580_16950 [Bacteroidota bacterium]
MNSVTFYRNDKYYNLKYRIAHTVLIWLIPFIYMILLKALGHRSLGSHHYDKINRNLGEKGPDADHLNGY